MGTPRISYERAKEAVDAASAALLQGLGARQGARRLGITENALQARLRVAKFFYGLEPVGAPNPPAVEFDTSAPVKQRIRVKAPSSRDDSPVYRVVGVGDFHDAPELDKTRAKWIGRHVAETKPDACVWIGDIADFDSLSRHATPGSMSDKLRPSYARDLESLEEALSLYRKECDTVTHVTGGNHEARIWRYEEQSAAAAGMLTGPFLDVMARFDMRYHMEGEWLMFGGVGFVHAPTGLTGRLMGGEWMNAIANRSRISTVMGHSHRAQVVTAHKLGPFGNVTLLNLGTSLPYGFVKPYAKIATSGWSWGVFNITIQAGHIIGHDFISMQALAERYGP